MTGQKNNIYPLFRLVVKLCFLEFSLGGRCVEAIPLISSTDRLSYKLLEADWLAHASEKREEWCFQTMFDHLTNHLTSIMMPFLLTLEYRIFQTILHVLLLYWSFVVFPDAVLYTVFIFPVQGLTCDLFWCIWFDKWHPAFHISFESKALDVFVISRLSAVHMHHLS